MKGGRVGSEGLSGPVLAAGADTKRRRVVCVACVCCCGGGVVGGEEGSSTEEIGMASWCVGGIKRRRFESGSGENALRILVVEFSASL